MDKETTILIISQNGLKTASGLLAAKAAKLEKQAEGATDPKVVKDLKKKAAKTKKLSVILASADEGITAYMRENAS